MLATLWFRPEIIALWDSAKRAPLLQSPRLLGQKRRISENMQALIQLIVTAWWEQWGAQFWIWSPRRAVQHHDTAHSSTCPRPRRHCTHDIDRLVVTLLQRSLSPTYGENWDSDYFVKRLVQLNATNLHNDVYPTEKWSNDFKVISTQLKKYRKKWTCGIHHQDLDVHYYSGPALVIV